MSNSKLDDLLNNYDTQDEMNEAAKEELAELRAEILNLRARDKRGSADENKLRSERDALAAALRCLVERDVMYMGGRVDIDFPSHEDALRAVTDARAALAALDGGK